MDNNVILVKSKDFAVRIVKLCQYLRNEYKEYALSDQLIRSGTSIGANVRESTRAQSRADFFAKMYIAYKESDETAYWLEILHDCDYLDETMFNSIYNDCQELIKLLTAIAKNQNEYNR